MTATWITKALQGIESNTATAPSSSAQSFYFINFSWNFISQQAGVCHPSAPLTMSPLPTFYLHFTTFSGCSATQHLAEIPNILSWICLLGVLPKFTPSPLKSYTPKHPGSRAQFQDNFFVVKWSKAWHIMCQCSTQLTSQISTCIPFRYFPEVLF